MEDCIIRQNREQEASFLLGFNLSEEEGVRPEYYELGREFGEYITNMKVMLSHEKRIDTVYMTRFMGEFGGMKSLRNKYADCLSGEGFQSVNVEIGYFQKIIDEEKVPYRLEKLLDGDL